MVSAGIRFIVAAWAAVVPAALWTAPLQASPMASLPAPWPAYGAAGLSPGFEAKTIAPGALPAWSLRTDLDGFGTVPALSVQVADGGKPGGAEPPQGADTLPEPASILVLAIGLAGLYSLRRPKPPGAISRFSSLTPSRKP